MHLVPNRRYQSVTRAFGKENHHYQKHDEFVINSWAILVPLCSKRTKRFLLLSYKYLLLKNISLPHSPLDLKEQIALHVLHNVLEAGEEDQMAFSSSKRSCLIDTVSS